MSLLAAVLDHYGIQFSEHITGEQSILCPVHDERNKSCSINLSEDVFNCHACGHRGGPLRIVVLREGLDIAAATKFLQEIATSSGTELSDRSSPRRRVSKGQGFKPGYRRGTPPRRRDRRSFGS